MSKYLEKAKALRADKTRHYNCAQSVLIPFAGEAGLDDEQAFAVAANFGAGMKMGSVCGAVTGGLMALGLLGIDNPETIARYYTQIRNNHSNVLTCEELLKLNAGTGTPKKDHCDDMVYECVNLVEDLIRNPNP